MIPIYDEDDATHDEDDAKRAFRNVVRNVHNSAQSTSLQVIAAVKLQAARI